MLVAHFIPIQEDHRCNPAYFICEKEFILERGVGVYIIGAPKSLTTNLRNRTNQTTRSYNKKYVFALMTFEGSTPSMYIPTRLPLNELFKLPGLKIKMTTGTAMRHILFMTSDEKIIVSDNVPK